MRCDSLCAQGGAAAAADDSGRSLFRIPDSIRPKLRWRVGNMLLHPSFTRRFRNPFSSIASWQIEDCSRALQCFLPMIFRPERSGPQQPPLLQPDLAKQAFGHLKRFAAFHLGHVKYSTTLEYIAAAQEAHAELLNYGKLMEQVGHWRVDYVGMCQPLQKHAIRHGIDVMGT